MGGRGRGRFGNRGGGMVQIDDGTGKKAPSVPEPLKPRDKYPPLRITPLPPLPLPKEGDEGYHKLLVFQNYLDIFQKSSSFTTLPEKSDGIERYSDRFFKKTTQVKTFWDTVPDSSPKITKKITKKIIPSASVKRKQGDVGEPFDVNVNEKAIKMEEEEDDDENVEEEEEIVDELFEDEVDDDYNQMCFDDDEDYPGDDDD